MQFNSASPVAISPRREDRIVYLQHDCRRTEWRRESRHALWPNGPRVTYYEHRTALIEIFESGTSRAFTLDLDHHTYAPSVMSQRLSDSLLGLCEPQTKPSVSPTNFAVIVPGGGADVPIVSHAAVRAGVDYAVPISIQTNAYGSLRVSFGVAFKFW